MEDDGHMRPDGVDSVELEDALDALENSADPYAATLLAAFDAVCSAVVDYSRRFIRQRS